MLSLSLMLMGFLCMQGYAQGIEPENDPDETYVKQNIGLTNFKILGISRKQYAKCLESMNFLEPQKKLRYTVTEKVEFADDGQGYDLVANDGIMTSKVLFYYEQGTPYADPGQYLSPKENPFVHDRLFAHTTSKISVSVDCDVRWIKCSEWPSNLQNICKSFSWPFKGYLDFSNCKFGIKWESY